MKSSLMQTKKRYSICLTLALIVTLLAGCVREKQHDPNSALVSDERNNIVAISEIDLETEHMEFWLRENVKVDATVVPYSDYKDGVNSYFVWPDIYAGTDISWEILKPMYEKTSNDIMDFIESHSKGSFNRQDVQIMPENDVGTMCSIVAQYEDIDNHQRQLLVILVYTPDQQVKARAIDFYNMYKDAGEGTTGEWEISENIREYYYGFPKKPYVYDGSDTIIEEVSEFMETYTYSSMCDQYVTVPVNQESFEKAINNYPGKFGDLYQHVNEEHNVYYIYSSADGHPMKEMMATSIFRLPEEMDPATGIDYDKYAINTAPSCSINRLSYDKDGIRSFQLWSGPYMDGIYKEMQPIADIKEVLTTVRGFFDDKMFNKSVYIYNISLTYGGNFTDEDYGLAKRIMRPYWEVEYAIKDGLTAKWGVRRLILDAYTAELYFDYETNIEG